MQQSYETILIYQKRREPCWTLSLSREAEGFPESIRDDEVDECLVILRGEGGINPILVHILYTDAPEVVRRAEPLTEEFLHRLEAQYMEARREDTISKIRQIEKSASRGKDEGTSRGSPSV